MFLQEKKREGIDIKYFGTCNIICINVSSELDTVPANKLKLN